MLLADHSSLLQGCQAQNGQTQQIHQSMQARMIRLVLEQAEIYLDLPVEFKPHLPGHMKHKSAALMH